jgi:hypothetical protein
MATAVDWAWAPALRRSATFSSISSPDVGKFDPNQIPAIPATPVSTPKEFGSRTTASLHHRRMVPYIYQFSRLTACASGHTHCPPVLRTELEADRQ